MSHTYEIHTRSTSIGATRRNFFTDFLGRMPAIRGGSMGGKPTKSASVSSAPRLTPPAFQSACFSSSAASSRSCPALGSGCCRSSCCCSHPMCRSSRSRWRGLRSGARRSGQAYDAELAGSRGRPPRVCNRFEPTLCVALKIHASVVARSRSAFARQGDGSGTPRGWASTRRRGLSNAP